MGLMEVQSRTGEGLAPGPENHGEKVSAWPAAAPSPPVCWRCPFDCERRPELQVWISYLGGGSVWVGLSPTGEDLGPENCSGPGSGLDAESGGSAVPAPLPAMLHSFPP